MTSSPPTRRRKDAKGSVPPEAMDVHDGVPASAARPSRRRLGILLAIFAAWLALLLYVLLAGRPA